MRRIAFMFLITAAGFVFANQIDDDITDLQRLIKRSEKKLESLQQDKVRNLL